MIARTSARTVALAGVLVLAGLLAGCTPAVEPEPTDTPAPTESEAPPQVTDITDPAGSGEGWVGALDDTEVTACEAGDAGWHVAGTATNSSDTDATYRIYVSVLAEGDALRALKQIDVPVTSPGTSVEWSGDVAIDGADDLYCVLRVERYVAAPADDDDEGDEG